MAKRGDPKVLQFVVLFLRHRSGLTQAAFGQAARVTQATISVAEAGKKAPDEEALRRMARVAGVPWPLVVVLRRFFTTLLFWLDRVSTPPFPHLPLDDEPLAQAALEAARLALLPYQIEEEATAAEGRPSMPPMPPEQERREAEEIWAALEPLPHAERQRWIELSLYAAGSWALAETIAHASARAAANDVTEALALAELALGVARRVPGEARRARTEGYCTAFLANALRVATEFARAEAAFARAWELWQAGEAAASLPLAEGRLLDLEASLRRAQHRFSEALGLLERALAACAGGKALPTARLRLNKANVQEQMGEHANALATLKQAAPAIETARDPDLLLRLRFNTAVNLVFLERHGEADELLPEVRELAAGQAGKLDRVRLVWLEAKVAAGRGREEEARAGLDQVIRAFTGRELPYEAALASLDLAVLDLQAGRTAEVAKLAVAMSWIFETQGIAREALAALRLFYEAARRQAATVELAKRVMAELERAQRSASP